MDGFNESLLQVGTIATDLGSSAWLWAGNFLALIILTIVLLFFAMRAGRAGVISLILALYAGYALYVVFPYTAAVVSAGGTPLIQAAISIILFAAAAVVPFLLVNRLTGGGFGSLSIIQNFILALLAAGFLMALGYHVFDISNIYTFSEPLNQLFEPEGYFFYWFVAPLIGLYFLAH
ncbi:MAG TPA: hypothetical protein VEB18_03760 [Candidatus Paceibacterota bacterium]|nr:hypothetical protein [Candidatus Paceibacterota bacterium]